MPRRKTAFPSISANGQNVVGFISASGKAKVQVTQKSDRRKFRYSPDFERLFALLDERLKERLDDPSVSKEEIGAQIERIKKEAALGDKANQTKLERWVRNLAEMAPDIVDVMTASLGGPLSSFTAVLQKVAAKVKAEYKGKG